MRWLWLTAILLLVSGAAWAEPIRIATFNASLSRNGPGVLLDKILGGKDKQIIAVARIIKTVRPDILLINELDHDYENLALKAFLKVLEKDEGEFKGIAYLHFFAPPQNTGVPSGLDLNGDGKLGGPADAFGYGRFRGQYGMALISRFPIDTGQALDFSELLWIDFPQANLPTKPDGQSFLSLEASAVMRLSSKGHWDVPVNLPDGRALRVMASHPTPPVFDGPEDFNGKRNADEILFWDRHVAERSTAADLFVILGDLNSDPLDGDSSHNAISKLLKNPLVQNPVMRSGGAAAASQLQGAANLTHKGDPALDTADFRDDPGPGNLRVDYVLPSKTLKIIDAGVFWPAPKEQGFKLIGLDGRASSDHRLVWVDVE